MKQININKNEFILENYHKFVDQKLHNKIIKKQEILKFLILGLNRVRF